MILMGWVQSRLVLYDEQGHQECMVSFGSVLDASYGGYLMHDACVCHFILWFRVYGGWSELGSGICYLLLADALFPPVLLSECGIWGFSAVSKFKLTLLLVNQDISCLCKQCRSRSVGFWRSQHLDLYCLPLSIWIYSNSPDQAIWLAEN